MNSALENLSKIGAEFYAEAQAAAQAAGAAGAPPSGDSASDEAAAGGSKKKGEKKADVVDADFEVVDEDKTK